VGTPAYAGKTFRFTAGNGTVFHNTYGPAGTELRHETVAGPGTGTAEDVGLPTPRRPPPACSWLAGRRSPG
jgi:hypothetical protein